MSETETGQRMLIESLVARVQAGWAAEPVFVDPIVAPGLEVAAVQIAARDIVRAEQADVAVRVAFLPDRRTIGGYENVRLLRRQLDRLLRRSVQNASTISLVVLVNESRADLSGIVSDADGSGRDVLAGDAMTAVEDGLSLAQQVEYGLALCLAEAGVSGPPQQPSHEEPSPLIERGALRYAGIRDNDDPDAVVAIFALVGAATAVAWAISRRERHSWQTMPTPHVPSADRAAKAAIALTGRVVATPKNPTSEQLDAVQRLRLVDDAVTAVLSRQRPGTDPSDMPVEHTVALALLQEERQHLRGKLRRRPASRGARPCFFNPLHAKASRERSWKAGRRRLTVPCCTSCAESLASDGTPRALLVKERGVFRARVMPYFATRGPYAESGFGVFRSLSEAIVEAWGSTP